MILFCSRITSINQLPSSIKKISLRKRTRAVIRIPLHIPDTIPGRRSRLSDVRYSKPSLRSVLEHRCTSTTFVHTFCAANDVCASTPRDLHGVCISFWVPLKANCQRSRRGVSFQVCDIHSDAAHLDSSMKHILNIVQIRRLVIAVYR